MGYRLRIWDGSLIDIWKELWICFHGNIKPYTSGGVSTTCTYLTFGLVKFFCWLLKKKPYTPMDVSLATLTVQNLIRTDLKSWSFDVLTAVFVAPDVSSIVRIPLHLHLSCEQRIKTGTRHGSYSVKSAYNLSVKYFTNSAELVGPVDCDLLYGALAYFKKKKKKTSTERYNLSCCLLYQLPVRGWNQFACDVYL